MAGFIVIADSPELSNKADEVLQFFTNHPEFFKEIETVKFFADQPDFFDAMKAMYCKVLANRDLALTKDRDNLFRRYTRLIEVIAETNIDFTEGIVPDSAKKNIKSIQHLLRPIAEEPLPLLWQAKQGNDSPTSCTDNEPDGHGIDNENNEEKWLTDFEADEGDIFSRLAVTSASDLTYQPNMFPPSYHSDTPWWYGALYTIKYPDDDLNPSTPITRPKQLDGLPVNLPRKVLDLGRLIVHSELEERSDGRTWSPSEFTVMVDMESETKAVWLVCDSSIVDKLWSMNERDGLPNDLLAVADYFDWLEMDLALLFPNINDWASFDNTWPVLESRIKQSTMKLGLSLHNI